MNLLHIDSSILGDASISRRLSAAIVEKCRKEVPDIEVTYRDLVAQPVAHITGDYFLAQTGAPVVRTPALEEDIKNGEMLLEEFLAADAYVIGVPMYNWAISSHLKTWIDRVCVVGRSFRVTAEGYQGLVGDKPMIIASSRGGFYTPGNPSAEFDHQETYIRHVAGVFGIQNVQFVRAEGVGISEAIRIQSIADAMRNASENHHLTIEQQLLNTY